MTWVLRSVALRFFIYSTVEVQKAPVNVEAAFSCGLLQLLVFKLLKRLHDVAARLLDSAGRFYRSELLRAVGNRTAAQVQEFSLDTLECFYQAAS